MFGHILVPLDGSELAEKALDYARQIVRPDGKLTLLSVVRLPDTAFLSPYGGIETPYRPLQEGMAGDYMAHQGLMLEEAQQYLNQLAITMSGGEQLHVECIARVGDPADVISVVAREYGVEAIVMSTHGRSGLTRWLFGSVTMRVLEVACCPVLVVPSRTVAQRVETQGATAHLAAEG